MCYVNNVKIKYRHPFRQTATTLWKGRRGPEDLGPWMVVRSFLEIGIFELNGRIKRIYNSKTNNTRIWSCIIIQLKIQNFENLQNF